MGKNSSSVLGSGAIREYSESSVLRSHLLSSLQHGRDARFSSAAQEPQPELLHSSTEGRDARAGDP
ncbi:hypothetical protein [Synechococcus sp. CBW1006]|uniref:hypothetical protein n=1 Tax=Synechococcus sp. CBW1006 TaxID=1353138 RepID=UPI0018CEFA3D|nr:hypothetical protein [Synechococcus sp. CBW1006]QPN67857.1 hypothetical protein H8F26_06935 [Synechococcus sp. CBW1006]